MKTPKCYTQSRCGRLSMFICENNRNIFWIYLAHKICQSSIPLKKEIKNVFHLATIQHTNMCKLLYIYNDCRKEVDNQLNIDLCLGNYSSTIYILIKDRKKHPQHYG
jgi:hypothetical protein